MQRQTSLYKKKNMFESSDKAGIMAGMFSGEHLDGNTKKKLLPHTSLDGLMQEAPATLVHHVHIGFVVNQSRRDTFQFTRECQVECQVTVVVKFIQFARELKTRENTKYI